MKGYSVYFLLSALFIVSCINAKAQGASVRGRVYSENYLTGLTTILLLRNKDSLLINKTESLTAGTFQLQNISPGTYLISISHPGFHKIFKGPFQLKGSENLNLGDIKLSLPESNSLNEVVIRDRKRYIDIRPDKTVLYLDRNILAAGTSILSVLGAAPGVKVNSAGSISLGVGQKPLIMINGKQVKLEGEDLTAFLQNFQSANVDQIELISNPSAKYDAAGAGGVINIILKKGNNYGFNGTNTATVGYGKFIKGGSTFAGNYRTDKINIFGSAGYNYNETYHTITYNRSVNDAQSSTFATRYYNTQKTPKFDYRIGADIFLDSLNTIGFLIFGSTNVSRFNKQTNTQLSKNGFPDSALTTLSDLKRHLANTDYNVNYLGRIGTGQTLTVDADVATYYRRSYEQLVANAVAVNPLVLARRLVMYNNDTLNNTAPTRFINGALKIDYSYKISKTNQIEAGFNGSYVSTDNRQDFNDLKNGILTVQPQFTSRFSYHEKRADGYASFIHTGNLLSYNAGLRYQRFSSDADLASTNDDIKHNFSNFYPSIQVAYSLKKSQLIFDYNRRVVMVDYNTVNPIVSYQDNYNYRVGNPYLRPAFANHVQLSYYKKAAFNFTAYYTQTSNYFNFGYFTQDDATKILVSTRINLKSYIETGIKLNLPFEINKWWNVDVDGSASYQHFSDYRGLLNKGTQDIILNLNQNFNITNTITASLYANYESPTFYGITNLQPLYYANAGISKQFSKSASLVLNAFDIFQTNRDRYRINFANLNMQGYDRKEEQKVMLSFIYKFGKKTVKGSRKHNISNEDEIKRMNSSSLN